MVTVTEVKGKLAAPAVVVAPLRSRQQTCVLNLVLLAAAVQPPPQVKTQRRKVVIEEIVNGQVVSRTEDEQEIIK